MTISLDQGYEFKVQKSNIAETHNGGENLKNVS